MAYEGVEGVPVGVDDVAADGPEVAEDEGGADEGMQLGDVHPQVRPGRTHNQHLKQLTQRHHLTHIHLINKWDYCGYGV